MGVGISWELELMELEKIQHRGGILRADKLVKYLGGGIRTLATESPLVRPVDRRDMPGGLVRLHSEGYYVIIPDLHGRMDFFNSVMTWTGPNGRPVIADMADKVAQVICVGDAFHSEARGRDRWQKALKEYTSDFRRHRHMDREMGENLGLLAMIASVKSFYPGQFHFLKGNHENVANEKGEGNYPFRKFAYEGEMVRRWILDFLGRDIFDMIYHWEKSLPLMAKGPDFLVCHCEPGMILTPDQVINAYEDPEVVYNLTWIDNDQADPGSVSGTLGKFGMKDPLSRIFGGHRPVQGNYSLRQGDRYVQVNTPRAWVVAAFVNMGDFDPEKNIICLKSE